MKYTVLGFQQEKLIEKNLNLNDAFVLRTVVDMYASNSDDLVYRIIDNEKYMWLKLSYLLRQVPIIGVERTLRRSLDKLNEAGAISKVIKNSKDGVPGKYQFLAPGKNLQYLIDYEKKGESKGINGQNVRRPLDKMSVDHRTNCPDKDSSNNIYSSKKNILTKERESESIPLPASNAKKYVKPAYLQEVTMLVSEFKLRAETILRYAEGDIQRIRKAVAYAKKHKKGAGWIVACVKDDYDLSWEPGKKQEEEAKELDVNKEMEQLEAMFK